MRKIENIIIHCSDSNWGDVAIIDKWHKERGWKGCGYHYVIKNGKTLSKSDYDQKEDGILEIGRPLDSDPYIDSEERGAHAKYYNKNSIGICLIGKKKFTVQQFVTLYNVIKYWKSLIPDIKVMGHYQVTDSGKTCPNFKIDDFEQVLDDISIEYEIEDYMEDYLD